MNYILNAEGEPVGDPDIIKWSEWFETHSLDRIVGKESIGEEGELVEVSTVFLGINHNFTGKGAPILWETMVFGGEFDQYQDRCSGSRRDAQKMHEQVVKMLFDQQKQEQEVNSNGR